MSLFCVVVLAKIDAVTDPRLIAEISPNFQCARLRFRIHSARLHHPASQRWLVYRQSLQE